MRVRQFTIAIVLTGLGLCGCAQRRGGIFATSQPSVVANQARLQSEVMNLVDDFITAIADVFDDVDARARTPQQSAFVQSQKTDIALGALNNAVNPYPFAGLMDTVVLITLARHLMEDEWTRQLLGDADAGALATVLRAQEATAWKLASRYLSDAQVAELKQLIADWRRDNPNQRSVGHVRLVDFLDAYAPAGREPRGPTSIFGLLFLDPLAGIDPAVRELEHSRDAAERMFFYFQRMSTVLSWQMETLYRRMLSAPQLTQALADVSSFSGSGGQLAEATTRFAESVEEFRKNLPIQGEATIEQLHKAVTAEREAAVAQATTQVSAQRQATIDQLASSLRVEQQQIVHNLEQATKSSIDLLYERLRTLVILTVIIALAALVIGGVILRALPARRR